MTSPPRSSRRIAIIGGGVTGLSAAVHARQLDPSAELLLLESRDRPGGVLSTVRRDGFLIERGADNFITNVPWAVELCRQVGLGDDLLPTDARRRQVFVVRRGRLLPVPPGFMLMVPQRIWPVLLSGVLSPWGKLRLLGEYFVPARKSDGDESLASFARRRLGREAFDRLVQPLIGGIYTADPEKLSLAATLPRFLDMERQAGGLIRGRRSAQTKTDEIVDPTASGARYSLFATPRRGLSSLIDALVERLPAGAIQFGAQATALDRTAEGSWQIHYSTAEGAARPVVAVRRGDPGGAGACCRHHGETGQFRAGGRTCRHPLRRRRGGFGRFPSRSNRSSARRLRRGCSGSGEALDSGHQLWER